MDRYWVGGSGNWNASNTSNWSTTSGGGSGASVPTSANNVFFDSNSGGGVVSLLVTANCLSLNLTGFTGTLVKGTGGTGTLGINIFDNLVVGASIGNFTDIDFVMRATSGAHTMTFNGNTSIKRLIINGSGGVFTLVDGYTGLGFTHTLGVFNPNGQTVTMFNAGYISSNTPTTFFNLTIAGRIQLYGTSNTVTVTGTFAMNGPSPSGRYLLKGNREINPREDNIGLTKTINAANVSISNCDFQDITGSGAGSWTGSSIGNGLGNSGITFTAPTTRYWVGNSGNWTSSTHWSTTSGGASGASMPLAQDNVIFDANSFSSGGQDITASAMFLGTNIDFSNVTNNPNLIIIPFSSTARLTQTMVLGNLTLGSGMTISSLTDNASITMASRTTASITTNGVTVNTNLIISTYNGTFNLNSDIVLGSSYLFAFGTGTLNSNNFDITCGLLRSSSSLSRTMNLGSSIITITGEQGSDFWNDFSTVLNLTSSLLTYNEQTSKIVITNTSSSQKIFSGNGITYNDIEFTGDNILVNGSNTFNDFIVNNAGETNGLFLNNSTTQTVLGDMLSNGTVGNLTKISEASVGINATISKSSGRVCLNYVNLTGITATGGASFRAGANSTNGGGNIGWQFVSCQASPICDFFMMFG